MSGLPFLLGLILLAAPAGAAPDPAGTPAGETPGRPPAWITRDQWRAVDQGAQVAALAPLAAVVARWSRAPEGIIVLRHPGGEAGTRWAGEVRDWLVALGVDGDHLRLVPGTAEADRIHLEFDGGPR